MKLFHKRGRGSTGFHISLFRITYVLKNMVRFLNEDFIKAVGGDWGGHSFMKLFHKILFFLLDGFPDCAKNLRMYINRVHT